MFANCYDKVLLCCRNCTFEDATSMARLARLYRKAKDIASAPEADMSYEDRCLRTADLEHVIADIQDMMFIKTSDSRRRIASMYERVAKAIKKYKSLDECSVPWNEAFVEALRASIDVAQFEGAPERAAKYRNSIPFYESLRNLTEIRDSLDVNTADWHDVMTNIYTVKQNIARAGGSDPDFQKFRERAALHREAAVAIRLNGTLSLGSMAWYSNAQKLHHAIHRLHAEPDHIGTGRTDT
jgi:hypothetical protein